MSEAGEGYLRLFSFHGVSTHSELLTVTACCAVIWAVGAFAISRGLLLFWNPAQPALAMLVGSFGALYLAAPPAVATANRFLRAKNAGPSKRGLCLYIWLGASLAAVASFSFGHVAEAEAFKSASVFLAMIAMFGAFGMFFIFGSAIMVITGVRPTPPYQPRESSQ